MEWLGKRSKRRTPEANKNYAAVPSKRGKITNRKSWKELWPHEALYFTNLRIEKKASNNTLFASKTSTFSEYWQYSFQNSRKLCNKAYLEFRICSSGPDLETVWSQAHCQPHNQNRHTLGNQQLSDFEVEHTMFWDSEFGATLPKVNRQM